MIKNKRDIIIEGSYKKPILIDVTYKKNKQAKQGVIFSHGFKGFKDWGAFNKMAKYFASQDIVFIKFNFSYNGTTQDDPLNFTDLEAFGNNNFCKELDDLSLVIDWAYSSKILKKEIDIKNISLFGHSRGGAISILKSCQDSRVRKIVSWASPSNLLNRLPSGKQLQKWRETNVAYVYNGRIQQNMPMYYQFYKNCKTNIKRLNIHRAVSKIKIPHLVVHGSNDSTVLIDEAYMIKKWNINTDLYVIEGADHVFGSFHPYTLKVFTDDLKEAIDATISFLKRQTS